MPTTNKTIRFNATAHHPASSYVRLYVWYEVPCRTHGLTKVKPMNGHIAIEASDGTRREYLGWWPDRYYVNREGEGLEVRLLRKFQKKVLKWVLPEQGRSSEYLQVADVPQGRTQTSPNVVDAILSQNTAVQTATTSLSRQTTWGECQPDVVYDLLGLDTIVIVNHVISFKNSQHNTRGYQFILNNCATVVTDALNAGGANLRFKFYCSPGRLDKHLKRL